MVTAFINTPIDISHADADGTIYRADYTGAASDPNLVPNPVRFFAHSVEVSTSLSAKEIDEAIRQSASDWLLSRWAISIDPKDIYIVFAGKS